MRTYCSYCKDKCDIYRETIEQYPGQYRTCFSSTCCNEPVVDEFGKPCRYGELTREYEERRSWEI